MPEDWVPDACTLPTSERPLRIAEFDGLLEFVQRSTRREPVLLDLVLPLAVEADARDLARRESECCSFFTFEFDSDAEHVVMQIGVPPEQIAVLDTIESRVSAM